MFCKNCGATLLRLMALAFLQDLGASVYPNAMYCSEGVEHDFVSERPQIHTNG